MNDDTNFSVGKIIGFHGLRGEVKIKSGCNNLSLFSSLQTMQAQIPGEARIKLQINSLRVDKGFLFASFADYPDRDSAESLLNAELFTAKAELEELEEEEFWVKDLVGVQVFSTSGIAVGKVIDVSFGGNYILEIRREEDPPGKTILIPFVKELVPLVDLKGKRIEITDLPGLLEAQ
ncbi:MAG: ribosome maturation factor RimM [Candidatus Obscuribacterales bacterium]|nr:ribosome maturation factor RimM [Candidatus Obscuribacterales bacterium]